MTKWETQTEVWWEEMCPYVIITAVSPEISAQGPCFYHSKAMKDMRVPRGGQWTQICENQAA